MSDRVDWLTDYFRKKSGKKEIPLGKNYFEAGLIDSLGVIELIEEMEDAFDIRFDASDFQDRRFSTVDGLARIIVEIEERQRAR